MKPYPKFSIRFFLVTYISLLLFSAPVFSQGQAYIDSILTIVESQEDTIRVASYKRLFRAAFRSNPEKAKVYLDSSRTIAQKLNNKSLIGSTANHYAIYLHSIGDYEGAVMEYDKSIKISQELGDKDILSKSLNNKALTLSRLGRMRQAIEVNLKSLNIKEELKVNDANNYGNEYWDESIAASYWNIGNLHADLKNYDKSHEYYHKALDIYTSLNLVDDCEDLKRNIALNLVAQGEYQKAIPLLKQSLIYLKANKYNTSIAVAYGNLTRAYIQLDSLDQAKQAINKAIALKEEHNDITLYGLHKRYEGDIWMKENKFTAALDNYKQALSIAQETDSKRSIIAGDLHVSNAYVALGDYKKAHEHLSAHNELYKEVLGKENIAKINELEILYQTERKEKELIIEKDKVKILEKEAKVSALQRWLLGLGLLIAIVSILFGWYSFRQKSKLARQEKEKLDAELEFKKKELTTHALHLAKKNELLEGLKNKAQALRNESEEKNGYRQLIRTIDFDLEDDNNWENFASYFQQVHKDFNQNVAQRYPDVTPNELRLISLVKMNLSVKEMANILNISVAGVKKARQRLRKKMNLSTKDSLEMAVLEIQ